MDLDLFLKDELESFEKGFPSQYRILGREILHLVSPQLEEKAVVVYRKVRNGVKKQLDKVKN